MSDEQNISGEYTFGQDDVFARNIAGDDAFYDEVNRVLTNLKIIRSSYPSSGVLVSYATNANGETFKITLQ